jgi:hypothetical protein
MKSIRVLGAVLAACLLAPTAATADFGLSDIQATFSPEETKAGSHPDSFDTEFEVNMRKEPGEIEGEPAELEFVDGALRDLEIEAPIGMVANPTAIPRCATVDFLDKESDFAPPACSDSTVLGTVTVTLCNFGQCTTGSEEPEVLYNLEPPPGSVAKLGFWASATPVTVLVGVTEEPPYRGLAKISNAVQVLEVRGSTVELWGNPADPSNDPERGKCLRPTFQGLEASCPAGIPVKPFLTLPRSCTGPYESVFRAQPWWTGDPMNPTWGGAPFAQTVLSPPGGSGCGGLGFAPEVAVAPTTDAASSPSGLEVALEVEDQGYASPTVRAKSDIKKVVLSLPEGVTANPSLAEGLRSCSQAALAEETLDSAPGEGCPQEAKIGTVEAETPVLEGRLLRGDLFIAEQFANPFNSLLAFYMVIRDRELGVIVKQAGKIEPNPETGQLESIIDDIPQFPLSSVRVRLREGGRSPLISPERCGPYTTVAKITPWARPTETFETTSSFQITSGVGGAPCPAAGAPPFDPGFSAGSLNNAAAAFSPVHMRLTRRDGDQDLTRFDATLPKGLIAKLAGVTQCPEAAIAAARARTSGRAELAAPSCPLSSRLGTVWGGAGVGSQLTYVPGSFYLAPPTRGAPLSVVAIVPAVAGPFDVGTVVVRQALRIDPRSAEVRVDSAASDSLPTILAGIPLKVRDVRVEVDRPQFTLNPTDCDPTAMNAQLWGSGALPRNPADDAPVTRIQPFQAAACASLGFKPKLALNLKGGTRRGDFPALKTTLTPRPGDANLEGLVLRLPRSAFLEQGHFRTICTRVQFAAGGGNGEQCPPGAVYGKVRVWTPLLDEPAEGNVYLRSSNNDLPDIVLALQGPPSAAAKVEVAARVDSQKGGIRVTVKDVPDLPVSKAVVTMRGGQRGLIVNSRNLCAKTSKANADFSAQNGKRKVTKPVVRPLDCKKSGRKADKKR